MFAPYKISFMTEQEENEGAKLMNEISRATTVLEKQNNAGTKFILGLAFGVGTAIGASIVASLILLGSTKVLQMVGFNLDAFMDTQQETVGE